MKEILNSKNVPIKFQVEGTKKVVQIPDNKDLQINWLFNNKKQLLDSYNTKRTRSIEPSIQINMQDIQSLGLQSFEANSPNTARLGITQEHENTIMTQFDLDGLKELSIEAKSPDQVVNKFIKRPLNKLALKVNKIPFQQEDSIISCLGNKIEMNTHRVIKVDTIELPRQEDIKFQNHTPKHQNGFSTSKKFIAFKQYRMKKLQKVQQLQSIEIKKQNKKENQNKVDPIASGMIPSIITNFIEMEIKNSTEGQTPYARIQMKGQEQNSEDQIEWKQNAKDSSLNTPVSVKKTHRIQERVHGYENKLASQNTLKEVEEKGVMTNRDSCSNSIQDRINYEDSQENQSQEHLKKASNNELTKDIKLAGSNTTSKAKNVVLKQMQTQLDSKLIQSQMSTVNKIVETDQIPQDEHSQEYMVTQMNKEDIGVQPTSGKASMILESSFMNSQVFPKNKHGENELKPQNNHKPYFRIETNVYRQKDKAKEVQLKEKQNFMPTTERNRSIPISFNEVINDDKKTPNGDLLQTNFFEARQIRTSQQRNRIKNWSFRNNSIKIMHNKFGISQNGQYQKSVLSDDNPPYFTVSQIQQPQREHISPTGTSLRKYTVSKDLKPMEEYSPQKQETNTMNITKQLANSSLDQVMGVEMDNNQPSLDQYANENTPENERLHTNSISLKLSQITKEDEIYSPEQVKDLAEQMNTSFYNIQTRNQMTSPPTSDFEKESLPAQMVSQFHLNTQRFPLRLHERKSSNDIYRNKPKTTPKTSRTKRNVISLQKQSHVVPTVIGNENVEKFIKNLSQDNQQQSVFDQRSVVDEVRTSLDQFMKQETEEKCDILSQLQSLNHFSNNHLPRPEHMYLKKRRKSKHLQQRKKLNQFEQYIITSNRNRPIQGDNQLSTESIPTDRRFKQVKYLMDKEMPQLRGIKDLKNGKFVKQNGYQDFFSYVKRMQTQMKVFDKVQAKVDKLSIIQDRFVEYESQIHLPIQVYDQDNVSAVNEQISGIQNVSEFQVLSSPQYMSPHFNPTSSPTSDQELSPVVNKSTLPDEDPHDQSHNDIGQLQNFQRRVVNVGIDRIRRKVTGGAKTLTLQSKLSQPTDHNSYVAGTQGQSRESLSQLKAVGQV